MDARIRVDDWSQRLGALLFPPTCVLCGEPGSGRRDLCPACARELPRNDTCCARCGLPLAAAAAQCADCLRDPPPFSASRIPFRYAWPLDRLLLRLKFNADLACARVLSELLGEALHDELRDIDALVPMPLHRARLAERGFNQALELARPLARRAAPPLRHDLLRRRRATAAQSELDRRARQANVQDAFAPAPAARLAGQRIALIDDVVTTGATAREAARCLLQAGAAQVVVWAVARAPAPRP